MSSSVLMRRLRRLGGSILMIGVIGLAGCTAPSPSAEPRPSSPAPPSDASAISECQPLELLDPGGDRVDLTGAWQGGVTFHEVRQSRDCVWWAGFSSWPGDELGDAWLLVFNGHLAADFTLSGEWSEIYTVELHAPRNCPVTFHIEFAASGDIELVTDVDQDDPCSYYAATMVRVDGPP